jgi:hypothetical protein
MPPFPSYSLIFTRCYIYDVIDVTHRKWRHRSIVRSQFPISVQRKFQVYCVQFTSYTRFLICQKYRFFHFSRYGRLKPLLSSSFDSSTTVSYQAQAKTLQFILSCKSHEVKSIKLQQSNCRAFQTTC